MPDVHELRNVPIFAVGQWNGDAYSESDLDHMVAAFGQVGFHPPIKLGHDESQALAKNDGMPAIGWVVNLRREGSRLYCDIKDLPKRVYEAIRRKNYNRVSAEVYWDYTCNGKKWPRVLKALSLLGASIPAVTSLGTLETLYDGEGQGFRRYDMGLLPLPEAPYPQTVVLPPSKPKPSVHYRESEDGGMERCGACRYLQGSLPDPTGEQVYIGECHLVAGEVATSWVCDLWEAREAFSSMTQKDYAIEHRGSKWVLLAKGSGEVLGEHDTEEEAKAQERAIQASKQKAKEQENFAATQVDKKREAMNRTDESAKTRASDAAAKERRHMEIEEIEGEFCVMKEGEKMKCFASKEEADAYRVSLMAQSAAEVKALQQKLDASEKRNKNLTEKVDSLEQMSISLSAKFSELEERTKTAEVEARQLKEQNRKAVNEAWLSQQASEGNLRVLPWEAPYVSFILDSLTGGQVKTYADNGTDISPAEAFRKLYEQRKPGTILTQELSSGGTTKGANQPEKREYSSLHEARSVATSRAKQYMVDHPEVKEFSAAFKMVLEQDSDLKSAVSGVTAAGAQKAKEGTERMQRMFNT